jgi:hypothetical protein
MIIKPYSYDRAVKRTDVMSEKSERNLWMANKLLKAAIEKSSFSGISHTDIELTLYSSGFYFDDIYQIEATIKDLRDAYKKEGYYVSIEKLTGTNLKVEGYRLEVNW